jgi:protein TonB
MRAPTVILSVAIHVGLAAGLIAAAQRRDMKRRAISVAVTEEKKKAAKPKPPPPPPPPVHRVAPKVVASLPKAETAAPVKAAAAAPVATNLTMSNADIGPGIGLEGRAAGPAPKSGPAAVKVASAVSDRRTQRTKEEVAGGGAAGDQPCTEPPTDPVPVVTTEINYSVYPQAQQEGIEGLFRARIIVGASGEVEEVEVLAGIDPGFDAAIKAALMRWRFKPAMACGKPVAGGVHKFKARFELAD